LDTFGADALRSALMEGAEGLDDMDWREKNARDIQGKLNSIQNFILDLSSSPEDNVPGQGLPELWLENEIQKHIKNVSANLDVMKTKSAFQEAFYSYWNDIRYYLGRTENKKRETLVYAAETWVKLLAPFIPFTAEETNSVLGNPDLVSTSDFPIVDQGRLHPDAELVEFLIQRLLGDSKNILKLMNQKPKSLHVYAAPSWSYELFARVLGARERGEKTSDTLEQFFLIHPDLEKKVVVGQLSRVSKAINELGENFLGNYKKTGKLDESGIYKEAGTYLGNRLGVEVIVHSSGELNAYDPKNKSAFATPFKPALYFE